MCYTLSDIALELLIPTPAIIGVPEICRSKFIAEVDFSVDNAKLSQKLELVNGKVVFLDNALDLLLDIVFR